MERPGFQYQLLFSLFIFPLITHEQSLIPRDEASLTDDTSDTCTRFERSNNSIISHYTQFRVQKFAGQISDINVTIIGRQLGCGYNLYITPLTVEQSNTWQGIWTSCTLLETGSDDSKELCSYWCKSPGYWEELQVLKVPRTSDESDWELCHMNITSNSDVNFGCSDFPEERNGVYHVNLQNVDTSLDVYCDEKTNGGGWTILMRRFDGSENFIREWNEYKNGFGSLTKEFWAGNEIMHKLTSDGRTYLLRVELRSYEGDFMYAEYSHFSVGPETDNYRIHVTGYVSNSTAGDSFSEQNGMMFSTASRDNDDWDFSCVAQYGAPWWHNHCFHVFLTGELNETQSTHFGKGIVWENPWGFEKFAKYVRMMIRPL